MSQAGMHEPTGNGVARVAYQGEPGAFSEQALRGYFGERVSPVSCPRFEDAGRLLHDRAVDFALLPVENSTIGVIADAVAVIQHFALREVAGHSLAVRLCLLGCAGARIEKVREVHSQPEALAQCTNFLRAHPSMRSVPAPDTAGAARAIARALDPTRGAIASRAAAARHRLDILAGDIQDDPDNRTRFAVLTV